MSEPYVDPSWNETDHAEATYIDPKSKVDEEINTATIPNYSRDKGPSPPGDKGRGHDKFWDTEEKDDGEREFIESISVFTNFGKMVRMAILGTQADKFLDTINRVAFNLWIFKEAMVQNHFPLQIMPLVYLPVLFVIMFFNCLSLQISWWISTFIILSFCLVIIGVIFSLIFVAIKGFTVYNARMNEENEEED